MSGEKREAGKEEEGAAAALEQEAVFLQRCDLSHLQRCDRATVMRLVRPMASLGDRATAGQADMGALGGFLAERHTIFYDERGF